MPKLERAAVLKPFAWFKPYAKNARKHSAEQISQIAASIKKWGWTNPILADEHGGIVAGHGRLQAAAELGLTSIPTIIMAGWSEDEKRAYVLADNQIALNASWDFEILSAELKDLSGFEFDLAGLGFDLGPPAKPTHLTDPDQIPDEPKRPISQMGDIWIMGDHKIICGDSTKSEDVSALLSGAKPHLMVTDPPYGVEYDAKNARPISRNSATGRVLNDDTADWAAAYALFPGDVAYVWHAMLYADVVSGGLKEHQFIIRAEIVWAKSQLVMSRGHYHPQHESCWYAVRKGGTGHWSGDRKQTTLWDIAKPQKSETGHSTQKPVECMKRPMENNSKPGDLVYEPFSGSGTSIIAGEMTGRCVLAVELNPAYVDMAVTRWQNFTGKDATLQATGETFSAATSRLLNGEANGLS